VRQLITPNQTSVLSRLLVYVRQSGLLGKINLFWTTTLILILSGCQHTPAGTLDLPEAQSLWKSDKSSQPNLSSQAETLASARGIWFSQENGWIIEIQEQAILRYQITPEVCYLSPNTGPTFMSSLEYRYVRVLSDDRIKLEYLPGDGQAYFERLAALPERCLHRVDRSSHGVWKAFASFFEHHYAFFKERGVDWQDLRDSLTKELESTRGESLNEKDAAEFDAVFDSMKKVIAQLNDSHTKLFATIEGKTEKVQYDQGDTLSMIRSRLGEAQWLGGLIEQTLNETLQSGAKHLGQQRIIYGKVNLEHLLGEKSNESIGYIQIFTMGGFTDTAEPGSESWAKAEVDYLNITLQKAIASFKDASAVIIDLSNNRGGYDVIARQIAAHFIDSEIAAYRVAYRSPSRIERVYRVEPFKDEKNTQHRYTGPLYLLTSDVTVSGGELATLTLKNLPQVTHFGSTTRGSFSTPLAKPLPNDWYLELSNELFLSMNSELFEGRGIPADVPFEVFNAEDPILSHRLAIQKIVQWHRAKTRSSDER